MDPFSTSTFSMIMEGYLFPEGGRVTWRHRASSSHSSDCVRLSETSPCLLGFGGRPANDSTDWKLWRSQTTGIWALTKYDAFENSKFLHCCSGCIICVEVNMFTWQKQSLVKITFLNCCWRCSWCFSKLMANPIRRYGGWQFSTDAFTVECCP